MSREDLWRLLKEKIEEIADKMRSRDCRIYNISNIGAWNFI